MNNMRITNVYNYLGSLFFDIHAHTPNDVKLHSKDKVHVKEHLRQWEVEGH